MKEAAPQSEGPVIPDNVVDLLKSAQIGYLSVTSKKGDLYSYPVAYCYSDFRVYMMTPVGSAKMKFMKANPNISFLVDNKMLALDACGVMIQGKAKVLSMGRLVASIVSLGPKMVDFAKKYPGMFTFYARGKYLPDERKLYKYRFIRIDPNKFVYWTGYTFGRYSPQMKSAKEQQPGFGNAEAETLAGLLATADEEPELEGSPADQDWLAELNSAASKGLISRDELRVISMYKTPLGVAGNVRPGEVSAGEKSILKKWRASKGE